MMKMIWTRHIGKQMSSRYYDHQHDHVYSAITNTLSSSSCDPLKKSCGWFRKRPIQRGSVSITNSDDFILGDMPRTMSAILPTIPNVVPSSIVSPNRHMVQRQRRRVDYVFHIMSRRSTIIRMMSMTLQGKQGARMYHDQHHGYDHGYDHYPEHQQQRDDPNSSVSKNDNEYDDDEYHHAYPLVRPPTYYDRTIHHIPCQQSNQIVPKNRDIERIIHIPREHHHNGMPSIWDVEKKHYTSQRSRWDKDCDTTIKQINTVMIVVGCILMPFFLYLHLFFFDC